MSATNQPYTEAQLDMIQRFNAAIRETPSSLAAPACSEDECGACETYRKAWLVQLQRADILEHALNEIRLMTHDVGALARAEDALKRSLSNTVIDDKNDGNENIIMKYTEQQLQLALARKLPELICFLEADNTWRWLVKIKLSSGIETLMIDMRTEITPREWPLIVDEITRLMSGNERGKLKLHLRRLDYDWLDMDFNQRATALADIGVITV